MTIDMRTVSDDTIETVGKGEVHYRVDNVFGSVVERRDGPQVFLVHQGPGDVTAPHFHKVPQFQVFTGGGGRFGRATIATPTVHYADAWTSYGPIVAGPDGVEYFTARVHSDVGASYMPESRQEKVHRSGRHFTLSVESRSGEPDADVRVLVEAHEDGLAAYDIQVGPRRTLPLPEQRGSGRLLVVVDGALRAEGREFGRWAWGYVAPGDAAEPAAAEHGARVLCLDYPLAA